ncbi:winged helix DNA-binding domain-containing protein [Chitinophaga sp. Cy-1792]|uniref:winged helix DNA-binding domain-containing protein n=1 Tax=Chitinophaga sp. Cy-1792 TaxID=2608339 RepID=UPI001422635C|nr:winged helix DNA-binding domain-containing protein [Chitinophaga sp. Cy-1792]NIG53254.1 winged helix DNA-binding domain-containing protein [Chitinophaga sp. Cy-1792]
MPENDIAKLRLLAQQITQHRLKSPQALVSHMGAIQAQDYNAGKYAVGLRVPGTTLKSVEKAINKGEIMRTWVFRGTLHIVTATDIRWMTALVKDRIFRRMRSVEKPLGIDENKYHSTIYPLLQKELKGGKQLMRTEIAALLEAHKIPEAYLRYLLLRGSLEGILCHGPMKGKQYTFTLLDEWVPDNTIISPDEIPGLLAQKYFLSHGPATVADFMTWGGITPKEAHTGLEAAKPLLSSIVVNNTHYWYAKDLDSSRHKFPESLLLPAFDEYYVAYKDRSHVLDSAHTRKVLTTNGIFFPIMVQKGQITGTWKRNVDKTGVSLVYQPFKPLKKPELQSFAASAEAYAAYLQQPLSSITVI